MGWFDGFSLFSSTYGSLRPRRSRIDHLQTDRARPHCHSCDPSYNAPDRTSNTFPADVCDASIEFKDLIFEKASPGITERLQQNDALDKNPGTADGDVVGSKPPVPPSGELLKPSETGMGKWSRSLVGFMTLFRRHKVQSQNSTSASVVRSPRRPRISNFVSTGDPQNETTDSTSDYNSGYCRRTDIQHSPFTDRYEVEHLDDVGSRKVSDQTVLSQETTSSSITVCRDPSKREPYPFATVDGNYFHFPPDEAQEASCSRTKSSRFSEPSKTTRTTTCSTDLSTRSFSDENSEIVHDTGTIPSIELSLAARHGAFMTRSLSQDDGSFKSILSERGNVNNLLDQGKAVMAFSAVAADLGLELPRLEDDGRSASSETAQLFDPYFDADEILPTRRKRLFGKIRTMRSSMSLKSQPVTPERSLRRIRTFASIPSRPSPMTSLKGRSLETLARLGGHSFLTLPAEFAPTTYRLPTCLVSTAAYLQYRAPGTRDVFVEPGSMKTAIRVYDHFADQVLSAEREEDKIQMTTRRASMPFGLGNPNRSLTANDASQVQAVAWVFRSFLVGLPGGILGSAVLYRVLINICNRRFSESEFKEKKNFLEGLTPARFAKVHAIALAILALTNEMQLGLICMIFGLCTAMLYETDRVIEFERQALGNGVHHGLINVDRLSIFFGPLLTDSEPTSRAPSISSRESTENERVAVMLITNWRSISRLMMVWQQDGYPPKQDAVPWTSCEGPTV